jgi:hypothetical protein
VRVIAIKAGRRHKLTHVCVAYALCKRFDFLLPRNDPALSEVSFHNNIWPQRIVAVHGPCLCPVRGQRAAGQHAFAQ